jgi:hypothetical protein
MGAVQVLAMALVTPLAVFSDGKRFFPHSLVGDWMVNTRVKRSSHRWKGHQLSPRKGRILQKAQIKVSCLAPGEVQCIPQPPALLLPAPASACDNPPFLCF